MSAEGRLLQAAVDRELVELVDGRVGQLVYFPLSERRSAPRPLRHGRPDMAGVRFPSGPRDRIEAVHPHDIVAIVPSTAAASGER